MYKKIAIHQIICLSVSTQYIYITPGPDLQKCSSQFGDHGRIDSDALLHN